MIRRKLKDFFMKPSENRAILQLLNGDELTLIERFLSAREKELQQYLAGELMERTLYNIDPRFRVFLRLFEKESSKLASMEKGVTYINEDYRGHYIHSVYNYLMGFYLFQEGFLGEDYLNCLNLDYFDAHYRERPVYDAYVVPRGNEREEFKKRWALTTFFHDVAYLPAVNLKTMEEEGKRLTGLDTPYSLELTDLQSFLTIPLVSKIKERVKMSFAPGYLFSEDSLEILAFRLVNRLDRFSKDLIYQSLKGRMIDTLKSGRFDHGLMGAIFLLQEFYSLVHAFFIEDEKKDIPHMQKFSINRNIIRFTDAMAAVALHHIVNFKTGIFKEDLKVKIRNHKLPLLFLLMLCDELQAWDRELPPAGERTQMSIVRAMRKERLDKHMFTAHYTNFYREYASPKKKEKELTFIFPFRDDEESDDDAAKEFLIFEKDKFLKWIKKTHINNLEEEDRKPIEYFKIKFTRKSLYYFNRLFNTNHQAERKIDKKIYKKMEGEAWKSFKRNHKTLGGFIELALGVEKFLRTSDFYSEESETHKNNVTVRGLETLADDILPELKLLKKGQDKLSPFLRPHHFHDIDSDKGEAAAGSKKDYCTLLLHYPGKDVEDVERVIKERIAKKLCGEEKKETALKYAEPPETGLNRIINNIYIPKIEEYIYDIQRGKYIVIEIKGGKNGGK